VRSRRNNSNEVFSKFSGKGRPEKGGPWFFWRDRQGALTGWVKSNAPPITQKIFGLAIKPSSHPNRKVGTMKSEKSAETNVIEVTR
jgi:hypothetical protein